MPHRSTAVVVADMEGVTGIHRRRQCHTGKPEWRQARSQYTEDVAAVVAGLRAGGFGRVIVRDVHDSGCNLHPGRLGPGVVWRPGPAPGPHTIYGDFRGATLAAFVGAHVGAGRPGFFPHTVWGVYESVRLGGRDVDELDLVGGVLASDGVPVGLVSGEDLVVESARARYPWLETVAIDKSESANTGPARESLWRAQRDRLFAAAARAARRADSMRPVEPRGPFRFEVVYRREEEAGRRAARWGLDRNGPRVSWKRPTFLAAFEQFLALTFFTPRTWPARRWLLSLAAGWSRLRWLT